MEREINTILISIEDYNKIKNKADAFDSDNYEIMHWYDNTLSYSSKDEVMTKASKLISEYEELNNELRKEVKDKPKSELYWVDTKAVRKWSILKFLKYRRECRISYKKKLIECAESKGF